MPVRDPQTVRTRVWAGKGPEGLAKTAEESRYDALLAAAAGEKLSPLPPGLTTAVTIADMKKGRI